MKTINLLADRFGLWISGKVRAGKIAMRRRSFEKQTAFKDYATFERVMFGNRHDDLKNNQDKTSSLLDIITAPACTPHEHAWADPPYDLTSNSAIVFTLTGHVCWCGAERVYRGPAFGYLIKENEDFNWRESQNRTKHSSARS